MGKILDRIMGKSLQGNQGIIGRFIARRQTTDGNNEGGYGIGIGAMFQSTVVDLRTTIHDAIEEAASEDGFMKKGLVSNVIPHIRQTRLIPPPPEAPAEEVGRGMNIPSPIPPKSLQVPVEDTRPLKKNRLQYETEDIRVLGGQYEIHLS